MKNFASLPLYIVTTLFAFGCVSAMTSIHIGGAKRVRRIQRIYSVPKQDPEILPSVPEQDPEILPSVPEQDPGSTDALFNSLSEKSCPNGWVPYNNHCYLVSKSARTWDEAEDFCEDLDAELVKIDDKQENGFVLGLSGQEGVSKIWIGLKSELRWYDGSVPTYTNWYPGEPNGQAATPCAAMYSSGSWDDIQCGNNIASVCEMIP